jgi:RNA polymerase sigma-70 factor (ECF subfamily)
MSRIGPELLAKLLEEHGPALTLFARQWCAAAEDVVQEAFLQLARQREPPQRIVPWLYRVTRNGAIDAGRAARRRGKHEAAAAESRRAWFVSNAENALDAAEAARALESLPVALRETIVARLWGGLSYEEIAELTETSTSTAHRRYRQGLTALREKLEESCSKTRDR